MMTRRKTIGVLIALLAFLSAVWYFRWWNNRRTVGAEKLHTYRKLVDTIAETMIPATETPGAADAQAGATALRLIASCEPEATQAMLASWLLLLERTCSKQYNRSFDRCTTAERILVLSTFEHDTTIGSWIRKIRWHFMGVDGLELLKKYVVIAYCTSMQGAVQGMAYDYVPGAFLPCTRIHANQRCWAIN